MGTIGFSYIGLLFLLMLFIPNSLWARNKPKGYTGENESKVLLVFERVGQVGVTCVALIFQDFNLGPFSPRSLWLFCAFLVMTTYELWWLRYFRSERELNDFYSSFLGVPVPGATLPVIAFFLLGIYGRNIWMLVFIIILGIGHVGIHLEHLRDIKPKSPM